MIICFRFDHILINQGKVAILSASASQNFSHFLHTKWGICFSFWFCNGEIPKVIVYIIRVNYSIMWSRSLIFCLLLFDKHQYNLGVVGDRVENVLWRARNISLPRTTSFMITHRGTNNLNPNQPIDIASGIMKIAKKNSK